MGMEKNEGRKKVEEVAMEGDKGVRKRVSKEKKRGRREGEEACMAQQYTIINLTESV